MFVLGSVSIRLMVVSSLTIFIIQRQHVLMCLIALEGVILTLSLMYIVQGCEVELFILFILLTFGACEASLGLACLVCIIRSYGRDIFSILKTLKC